MKKTLTIFNSLLLASICLFSSCSKENKPSATDELSGLQKVTSIAANNHIIDVYTASGSFTTGYNEVFLQIKNSNGTAISDASLSWMPVMKMTSMSHSCPFSSITKVPNAQFTYKGYIVFQMAGNSAEGWELRIDYSINGVAYTANSNIVVNASTRRTVNSFLGTDNQRYVMALLPIKNPIVGLNDVEAVVYRMENMMSFVPVSGYTILIDPRMPGMGNHGSPNNVNLVSAPNSIYKGRLSLTMSGLWKINLQLQAADGQILKGEAVTDTVTASSIYFEIEF